MINTRGVTDWQGSGSYNASSKKNESAGGSSSGNWDRAAGKASEPDQTERASDKERWLSKEDKQKGAFIHEESGEILKQQEGKQGEGNKPVHLKTQPTDNQFRPGSTKAACAVCGLKNHTTEECRRNMLCELCGFANHTTLDCKREPF